MRAGKTAAGLAALTSVASGHALNKKDTVPANGQIIYDCTVKGTVALTFDDGPFSFTASIVKQLTDAGHRATFFQNGDNYTPTIYSYGDVLQAMIAGGHQIASHTNTHADLTTLDAAGITKEMKDLETAHLALIGKAPTYMRPPYLATNDLVTSTLGSLGYKIISIDVDTLDYQYGPAGQIATSIKLFEDGVSAGGSIVLNHDPFETTANDFVPAAIAYLASKGLKSVPVGECLGDDPANWYRGGSVTPSSSAAGASSSAAGAASSAAAGVSSAAAPSGKASEAPKPSDGSYPSGGPGPKPSGGSYPTGSGSGPKPSGGSYPGGDDKPGKDEKPGNKYPKGKPGCGDTQPGHGPMAGKGSLPGHAGKGDEPAPVYNNGTGSWGTGSEGGYYPPSNTTTKPAKPTYYSNGATSLAASAVAILGAAALTLLL